MPHQLFGGDDSWKEVIGTLSRLSCLRLLHLTGSLVIGPDFFDGALEMAQEISFPELRDFLLEFSPETVDGRWFLSEDPGRYEAAKLDPDYMDEIYDSDNSFHSTDHDDDHIVYQSAYGDGPERVDRVYTFKYLFLPNTQALTPLLLDCARIAKMVAKLTKITVRMDDPAQDWKYLEEDWLPKTRQFKFQYLKAGIPTVVEPAFIVHAENLPGEARSLHQNRLYWLVGDWRADKAILDEWQELLGPDGHVAYLADDRPDRCPCC
jgi:hypothetical protein